MDWHQTVMVMLWVYFLRVSDAACFRLLIEGFPILRTISFHTGTTKLRSYFEATLSTRRMGVYIEWFGENYLRTVK